MNRIDILSQTIFEQILEELQAIRRCLESFVTHDQARRQALIEGSRLYAVSRPGQSSPGATSLERGPSEG